MNKTKLKNNQTDEQKKVKRQINKTMLKKEDRGKK